MPSSSTPDTTLPWVDLDAPCASAPVPCGARAPARAEEEDSAGGANDDSTDSALGTRAPPPVVNSDTAKELDDATDLLGEATSDAAASRAVCGGVAGRRLAGGAAGAPSAIPDSAATVSASAAETSSTREEAGAPAVTRRRLVRLAGGLERDDIA